MTGRRAKEAEEITVAEAARRIGVGPRAVVKAIKAGAIKARESVFMANAKPAWLVDAASVAAYAATPRKPGRKPKE